MSGNFNTNRASHGAGVRPPLKLVWSSKLVSQRPTLPLVACAGRLFCGTEGGAAKSSSIICASADSGARVWEQPSAPEWPSFVYQATSDVVLCQSRVTGATARSASNGRVLWRRLDVRVVDGDLAGECAAMIRTEGELLGIELVNVNDGATVWRKAVDFEPHILYANRHSILVCGAVQRGSGIVESVDPANGESIFRVDLEARFRNEGEFLPDSGPRSVVAAIAVQDHIYVTLTSRLVVCLSAANGEVKWSASVPTGQPSSLACLDDRLYFNSSGCLAVLDARTGTRLVWRDYEMIAKHAQGWLWDGIWYLGRSGGLDAFDADGEKLWTFPTDDFLGGPFEYEGHLFVPSVVDGRIYCFGRG